jgi:hypothetical protein
MSSGIYKITNKINNKCYIGSAVKIKRRWNEHRALLRNNKHHSPYLQNSWNRHGEDAFLFEVLETVKIKDNLIDREQHYLDLYESYDKTKGYNVCPTAYSRLGYKHPNETKKKISKALKGRVFTQEWKNKLSKSAIERCKKGISEETRRKMSEAHKGRSAWNEGIPHTEETKQKISDSLKGRPSPNKGNKYSAETIKKMKESRSGTGNARSIFTEEQVRKIRKLNKQGVSQRKLAEMFKCSRGAIVSAIKRYKNVK